MKVLNILSRTEVGSNLWQPRTKIHQGGLGDSEDESDAKIFSVPASETGQQPAPHIQLELMPRQQQQENADRVLVENNFDRDNVCHMAIKVFRSIFTTAMCKCTTRSLLPAPDNYNSSR